MTQWKLGNLDDMMSCSVWAVPIAHASLLIMITCTVAVVLRAGYFHSCYIIILAHVHYLSNFFMFLWLQSIELEPTLLGMQGQRVKVWNLPGQRVKAIFIALTHLDQLWLQS